MYFITPVFNLTQLIQYNLEYNSLARLGTAFENQIFDLIYLKMVTQLYYCLLIFMLSGAIFVDLCSRNWVKRKVSSTDQTTSSTTDSPTTSEHAPVVIRRMEMLVFPIKGKRRLAILKEC